MHFVKFLHTNCFVCVADNRSSLNGVNVGDKRSSHPSPVKGQKPQDPHQSKK